MSNNLMVVKQLPIIEERLKTISDEIDKRTKVALAMVCSDDTVKEVKKLRADLNKEKAVFEDERKSIKTAIMSPYEEFDSKYKTYVKDKYDFADTELKKKIDAVENGLKEQKRNEVRNYFNEYLQSKNIDFISFEGAHINVTLSASMKSLKEQAKSFIDRVSDDLSLIDTQEHKAEILVEYKKTLNVSSAITQVVERHAAIRQEQERAVEVEEVKSVEVETIKKVEAFAPPVVEEEVRTLAFKVTDTIPRLRSLKKFLEDGGYKYE